MLSFSFFGDLLGEKESIFFKTNFVKDLFPRKIKKIMKQYEFALQMVSVPNKKSKPTIPGGPKKC